MQKPTPATVVLVHGAGHGAWCWQLVLDGLAAHGVPARAIDLPGHGDDPGPLVDMHGDAARVTQTLDSVEGPVVLVGHSFGGVVITEAGVHESVVHLVYIAAFIVDAGESAGNAAAVESAALDHSGRPDPNQAIEVVDGIARFRPGAARAILYQDCDLETAMAAEARLGPQLLAGLQQAPVAAAWRSRPSTYVVCAEDLGVHPDLQRILARRATATVAWPTGHSPFLSRPDLVTDLLVGLARTHHAALDQGHPRDI